MRYIYAIKFERKLKFKLKLCNLCCLGSACRMYYCKKLIQLCGSTKEIGTLSLTNFILIIRLEKFISRTIFAIYQLYWKS